MVKMTATGTVISYNTTEGEIVLLATYGAIAVSVRPAMAKDPMHYAAVLSQVAVGSRITVHGIATDPFTIMADHVEESIK